MKKLNTSFIGAGVGQPITKYTLDHLQEAYTEAIKSVALGFGINDSAYTVLYGCVNTGTYPTFTISAGAIYHAGEIYLVPAASFNAGANTAVGTLTTSYIAQDPLTMSNGSSEFVHEINTIVFAAGVSGSGDVDYDNTVKNNTGQTFLITNGILTPTGTSITTVNTGYFRYFICGKLLKFRMYMALTTAAATLTGVDVDLSSVFTGANNSVFNHLGNTVQLNGTSAQTYVSNNSSVLNIASVNSEVMSATTTAIIQFEGEIEIA